MKLRFTHLLPILVVVMIVYEFNTYGWTIYASVNKLLLGAVYGILLYIAAYLIKAVAVSVWNWVSHKSESDVPQFIES